jgi:TatD DNase family protein
MFLHSRNCEADFLSILREHHADWSPYGGVVHSFTGTITEAREAISLGLYIGLNGCSFKTEENLAVVREIPLDRILLETDAPWCGVKRTHASHALLPAGFSSGVREVKKEKWEPGCKVKDRSEPMDMVEVCHIVAALKGATFDTVRDTCWENTSRLFGPKL